MKCVFLLAIASLCLSSAPALAENAPAKKSSKKAYKKLPPSEPVAAPEVSPTPAPSPSPEADATTAAPVETPAPAAPTSVVAEAPPAVSETAQSEGSGKTQGVLGDILFGPSVTLLGFPSPFRFGLEAKYAGLVGLSVDYGLFPNLTFSNIKLKYNSWRVGAQVYPWRGAFYIGVGFGKQNFTAAATDTAAGTTVTYDLTVNTTIFTPHIGWRWVGTSGFFFGMELGAQVAASSTAAFTTDTTDATVIASAEYQAKKTDLEDKGKTFGQTTLPHFALVQIGWLF